MAGKRIITVTVDRLTEHADWLDSVGHPDKATECRQWAADLDAGADARETQEKRRKRRTANAKARKVSRRKAA